MRAYSSFSWEQKERIYSLARSGVPDEVLRERYNVDDAILLMIYDEVLCELQRRRGYTGARTLKDFLRNADNDGVSDDKKEDADGNAQRSGAEIPEED